MSDFLAHLAARSLGRLETLQPRLPSRFEPIGPAAAPGLAGTFADSDAALGFGREVPPFVEEIAPRTLDTGRAASSEVTDLQPRRFPGSVGVLAGRAGEKEPARTPALPGKIRSAPDPTSSGLAEEPAAATAAPEESVPPVEEPAPRRDRRSARPAAPEAEDAPEPAADRLAPPANHLAPRLARLAAPPAAPTADPLVQPAGRGAGREPGALPEPRPAAVRLEPKVILAPPAPAAVPLGSTLEPRSSEAPAPAIQVTIGRLEVRATPAANTASAASSRPGAAAKLTLAEYLGRRSRGGHR